jgi:multiple sugar transport system permease protein
MLAMQIHDRYKGYFFILPAFILLVSILGFPAIAAVLQSFNLMWVSKPSFTISSYLRLFQDAEFLGSLVNTIIFVSTTVSFHLLIGLGVALLLNLEIKRRHVFRVIAILPWTMPDVIGGLIWKFIFDTLPGFVNGVLIHGGMLAEPIDFLGTPFLAFGSFILAEIWRGYPFVMLILLAGLQAIPRHQYEAGAIDGASSIQSFLYITLPNLKYMVIIAMILDTIWECRLFGMVYSMTGGGPGYSSQVLSLLTYKHYFQFFNTSYAASIAVVLAVIMLIISIPYLRITMRREV